MNKVMKKLLFVMVLIYLFSLTKSAKTSDLIRKVISNIVKAIPQFKEELLDSSKRADVINKIVLSGFTNFKQTADLELFKGVDDRNLDGFLKYLKSLISLPDEYEKYFVENLSMILFSDFNEIVIFRVLFSVDKGGDCKYICVMGQRNEDGNTDWLVGDVKADFTLAPDILVIEKSTSGDLGLYKSYVKRPIRVPKSLSEDQLSVLFKFFEICVFERFAELLKIDSLNERNSNMFLQYIQ